MNRKIDFLEYLGKERTSIEIFDEFGYSTGPFLLGEFVEEGFLDETKDKKNIINSKGKKHLAIIKKEKEEKSKGSFSARDIKTKNLAVYQGNHGRINQTNIEKAPREDINPFAEIISKIAEKLGVKFSLWIMGIVGFSGTGFYGYGVFNNFNNFNPFDKSMLISGIIGGIGFFFLIGFFVLLVINKLERCRKCNTLLGYREKGDGKILGKSPDGRIKVKREYKCRKCKNSYEVVRWEGLKKFYK